MPSPRMIISEERLRLRVEELAHAIAVDMRGKDFVLVGALKGSVVFLADLMRGLHRQGLCPMVDFITMTSYGEGTQSSGRPKIIGGPHMDVTGKSVLLVDDIADTALTLKRAREHVLHLGAKEAFTCVLLDKPDGRKVDFVPDYHGFSVGNIFVVGYGLDVANRHRCLPYIAELDGLDG